ncbi:hypothetical protein JOM56_015327 [Amanita muscaria]
MCKIPTTHMTFPPLHLSMSTSLSPTITKHSAESQRYQQYEWAEYINGLNSILGGVGMDLLGTTTVLFSTYTLYPITVNPFKSVLLVDLFGSGIGPFMSLTKAVYLLMNSWYSFVESFERQWFQAR